MSESIFMHTELSAQGLNSQAVPSTPLFSRAAAPQMSDEAKNHLANIQRGTFTGNVNEIVAQLGMTIAEFQRTITSTTANLPVRENLESEVAILQPTDTPLRNRIPRNVGAGLASSWRTLTSVGDANARMFFKEDGSPAENTSVYANKSAGYKLLGKKGSVTGFAMAAGANFQNQLATEKTNTITQVMLDEEKAIINGDSTAIVAPWGDGVTALAFDGLVNLIATAKGTPAAQVQSAVGALTKGHIDGQLKRLTDAGGKGKYIIANGQEIMSLVHLAEGEGSIIRVSASSDGKTVLGVTVTGFQDALTGEIVPVIYSRELAAGTMIFGCDRLPDGKPALDIDVLPQVELPVLAPNTKFEGYVAQEIAPSENSPQTYRFLVSVYEVLRMHSALHFAKSSGLTAV